jgi:hypothetical protein
MSVRAFLFDNPEIGGLIFSPYSDYNQVIGTFVSKSNKSIRLLNEKNLKKLHIKSQELFLLPKNKKLVLINLVDSLIQEFDAVVVFDQVRADPFAKDELFDFIIISLAKNPYQHSLDYNTIFYYPKNIYFDFSKQIADEEIGYEITSFKAL